MAFQEAFINFIQISPSQINVVSEVFKTIEEFVCKMYGLKTKSDVNKGRFKMFERSYKNTSSSEEVLMKKSDLLMPQTYLQLNKSFYNM